MKAWYLRVAALFFLVEHDCIATTVAITEAAIKAIFSHLHFICNITEALVCLLCKAIRVSHLLMWRKIAVPADMNGTWTAYKADATIRLRVR